MKRVRITFYIYIIFVLALAILSLSGVTGVEIQGGITANCRYILEMASVITTIIAVPIAIKGFARLVVKATDNASRQVQYIKYCHLRLLLILLTTIVNIVIYNILNEDSSLYCAMICIVTLIYCFPSKQSEA